MNFPDRAATADEDQVVGILPNRLFGTDPHTASRERAA